MSCDEFQSAPSGRGHTQVQGPEESITLNNFSTLLDTKLLEIKQYLAAEITNKIAVFTTEVKSDLNATVVALSNQLGDFRLNLAALCSRIEVLEKDNETLRKELSSERVGDGSTDDLSAAIAQLRADLNDRDQDLLLNDVEISGIPENDNESCGHILSAVALKLGVTLEERDVVSVGRVGGRRLLAVSSEGPRPRPRPLVLRLARRAIRDQLLRAARVRRGVTTVDLPLPNHEPNRFYLNERLTKTNRSLFGRARELASTHKWRFVWTRDGRILARKDEGSPVQQLRTQDDIDRVFGVAHR